MRLALLGLVLLGALLPLPAPASAAVGVQMQVRAGYEGAGKVGGWLPIVIDIRNDGDDVEGEIQISVQDTATNRGTYTPAPTVFTAPVVLPRRARKQVPMEIRLPPTGQRVRARLVQGEDVLLDQDVQFTRVAGGDLLCGMLSRTGSALEFIPTLELAPPLRRARLARMELNEVPNRAQLLASLDCLIVDNMPTAGLTEAQKDALRIWVSNGGLLIVAGGANWQRTLAGLPPDLLPVRVNGLATLDSLANLADFGGQEFPDGGQYLASQAIVSDGNPVVEQSGVPLVVGARRGLGTVIYLGLDATAEPLRSWGGSPTLWRYMLSHSATSATLSPGGSTPFLGWGRVPRNALVDIAPLSPPSPLPIVLGLAVFALVAGPGNFLLLQRLGQPSWALITVPLLTGLAALLLFGLASANRDSESIVTKVAMVRAMPNLPIAHARTYVGLLSRQDTTYDLRASEGNLVYGLFFPFPRDPVNEGPGWALKVLNGPAHQISNLNVSGGSLATFVVDGTFRSGGGFETDLYTDGHAILGTITNRSGYLLSDASLVLDYAVTRLGDLRPDETREVNVPMPAAASAGYGPPNSFASLLYPAALPAKKPNDGARRDLLDSAFGQAFNFTKLDFFGPTLIGWIETGAVDLDVRPARPANVESTLFLSSLAVRFPKGYEGDVPAPLVAHRPLGATTASRQQFGSYDLAPGESVALQYILPVHTGRFLLERLNLNVEARMRGPNSARAGLGEVQFFNWRTAEWIEYPMMTGSYSIENPNAFISSTGDVRLRYTFKPAPDAGVTGVTFSRLDVTATGLMR
jgi:hypothetical protein